MGEAAITRRSQKFFEDAKKERLEVHPVLSPPGQVLGLAGSAGVRSRLELEVGDIALGTEMRREPSSVKKSTERDEDDVVVGISRSREAVEVVGLQLGALLPDGSGIEEHGGHLVEEEESREEPDPSEMRRKREEARGEIKCLS